MPPRRTTTLLSAGLAAALTLPAACGGGDPAPTTVADCTPKDPSCPALAVDSECLGLVDNSGKEHFTLRLSQLSIKSPKVLTTPLVAGLVGDGVFINLPECEVAGLGTFSLITEFDKTAGTLRVGGAKPEADPTAGYCYTNDSDNGVAPVETKATFNGDGSFSIEPIPAITVPIYLDVNASSVVYLPLRQAELVDGTLSADNNCIGKFNAAGLEPVNQCKPDLDVGINYYVDGATLKGHITLEEADGVVIDLLNPKQSLCVLLSGDAKKYGVADADGILRCARDADDKIVLEGDWCSTDDSAGGCKDSARLEASLAASSVALRSNCQ